jgi:cytochrome c peroxidase
MEYPEDNGYSLDRWTLGKRLFYDKALSIDSSTSCASCHQADFGFADDLATTPGAFGRAGVRNSSTLTNIGYHPYFTRDGGVPTLEMQVLVPIQEHNEFGYNIVDIAQRLSTDSLYVEMSQKAYSRAIDPYVITRALANFERSLVSSNSLYDQYVYHGDQQAISSEAKKGMALFYSPRANCVGCHQGYNFTSYGFENNGLYTEYTDPGRSRLTGLDSDVARFKVPTLRNIALTGPYMHDGSFSSLEEVIEHYSNGVVNHNSSLPSCIL